MLNENDFKYLVGKKMDEAKNELPSKYFIFVADADGRSFYRTMDYNPYRINVWTKNDIISKIDGVN